MDRIMYADKRGRIIRNILTAAAFMLVVLITGTPKQAEAASSISVKEVNFENSTITLKVNDGDTEVYFSDSKKSKWQTVPGVIGSDNTIDFDISWINATKDYIITFKADKSTEIIKVTLPKQIANFKATYNKVKGTVSFSNVGTRAIEWRKKGSSIWNTVNKSTLSTQLSYLSTNGATVYFRLAPVNGTGTKVGYRASKEVTVAIAGKTTAPQISINGSSFSIAVKKGMAYRTVNSDGSTNDWTTISSSADLLLKNIAAKALYSTASSSRSKVTLQFRTNATSSAQVSKITSVTVPVQEGPPNEVSSGISLNYTSSSTVSIQVKSANSTTPFEFTVIKKDEELNYQTAKWTAITSSTAVTLDNKTAPEGSRIYVRKKSVGITNDDNFSLASVEINISTTNGLTYPGAPTASTLTTLISTAGVCQPTNSSSYLTFKLYSSNSTTVSAIHFLDTYGIDKGAVTCKSTVAKNSSSTGTNDQYIITTKITSTSDLDTDTIQLLYAKITLANSDVITSTDAAGVRLYLYPASTVNNPTAEEDGYKDYTDNFSRLYMSNDSNDKSSFKFRLDLGTAYVPSTTAINTFTSTALAISSIKYDGYTLVKDSDYTVSYGSYVNDDDKTITTATVTVNVANFEKSTLIDITDIAEALHITLNNGEELNDDVNITLVNTATLNNIPIAWTITEGKLQETKTTTTTGSDGKTTSTTDEVISYTLTLTLFDKNYSVGVSDVTWGDISVLGSTTISNGVATINLSNAKLNKLSTTSTDTKNIVITLSNGFKITTGCKLTLLNAIQ